MVNIEKINKSCYNMNKDIEFSRISMYPAYLHIFILKYVKVESLRVSGVGMLEDFLSFLLIIFFVKI